MALFDGVRFTTATTGTGPITVGAAVDGGRTPAAAGIPNGWTGSYGIEDGVLREWGQTVYNSGAGTFTRNMTGSTTGSSLNLSGSARFSLVALAADFAAASVADGDKGDIVVAGGVWSLDSGIVSAFSRTVLDDTSAAAWRTTLGLGTAALNASSDFEPAFAAGTSAQYRRGDKTWQTLDKAAVGLGNVDNTSDANKPISTAVSAALALKLNASLVSAYGLTLIDDADAATARGTLGLGTAAVAATGDFAAAAHVGSGGTAHSNAVASGSAGFMTGADKAKLDGIAAGATANSSDATLLNRANHTGSQLASTISDFAAAARAQVEAELVAGTNVTITGSGSGASRQLTIAASGGGGSGSYTVINVKNSPYNATGNGSTDDLAAINAAIAAALAIGSATVYFPKGTYVVSAPVDLVHAKGINLLGDGPDNTIISAGAYAAFRTRGAWRCRFEGMQFLCNGNTTGAAFELDGESDGSFGVQGNLFANCMFHGSYNSKYVFSIVANGGNNAQGSENLWLACWFQGGRTNSGDALILVNGNNALQNTLLSCNLQGFNTGIKVVAGNMDVLHCGFQSAIGYTQIANGGYDVDCSYSEVGDTLTMTGCRTESLRILNGGGSPCNVSSWGHEPAGVSAWSASTAKAADALVYGLTAGGNLLLYRCTTAGTTGSSTPTWPQSGTVSDGTAVWTMLDFNVFANFKGRAQRGKVTYGKMHTLHVSGFRTRFEDILVTNDDCFAGWNSGDGTAPIIENVKVTTGTLTRPIKLGYNGTSGARFTNPDNMNIGTGAIVSTVSKSGNSVFDLVLQRGGADAYDKVRNWWELIGGLRLAQVTFSELVTITGTGTVYFVTDGTPGSSPVTGGGSGCLAVWQNGAWRALTMGAGSGGGGGLSDGDYGDVTVGGSGTTMTIDAGTVTLAKQANLAANSIIGNNTGSAATPLALTAAQVKALLALTASDIPDSAWKNPVRAATTANGTLATAYANGQSIDGVTLATGNRILLKNQTTAADNGIYTVNASGAPTRATDADASGELVPGTAVAVTEGTANGDKVFMLTSDAAITIGTTAQTWSLIDNNPPGGSTGQLQYKNGSVFAGAANATVDSAGNLLLLPASTPSTPSSGLVHYSETVAGRALSKVIGPTGIAKTMQARITAGGLLWIQEAINASTPTVMGGSVTNTSTGSVLSQTIGSTNPWVALAKRQIYNTASAGSLVGRRTAYTQWSRGSNSAAPGFWFEAQFGQNHNVNGAQMFVGLCASTASLATTAGSVAALLNMIGMGYDTTDADTGNWQLFRNDGSGTATKVDLGSSAPRNTTDGYELIISCPPGNASTIYVKITNLGTSTVVLDSSYTTDIPATDTGLAYKAEVNNGAVASLCSIVLLGTGISYASGV